MNARMRSVMVLERVDVTGEPPAQDCPTESCVDAGLCNVCGQAACLDHSPIPAVNCEVNGFTCGPCHRTCSNLRCALDHADPDA